eukprot:1158366-Pelagomonas_calceolata.AAC.5
MASIEDVTKLIGLPYLGGPTKEASSPASGSNTARSSKAKVKHMLQTTPRASPAKPRTHGQSFQPAGMSKGGMDASIRVASGSAAASLMAASGVALVLMCYYYLGEKAWHAGMRVEPHKACPSSMRMQV